MWWRTHALYGVPGEKSDTRPGQRFASIVLKELAVYASLGCDPPPPPPTTKKARHGACVALALAAMGALSTQYARHCDLDAVQHGRHGYTTSGSNASVTPFVCLHHSLD